MIRPCAKASAAGLTGRVEGAQFDFHAPLGTGAGAVHGLANLFIADGSFMPTAGGTNPSLTIAAHGLRVGAIMAERLAALRV